MDKNEQDPMQPYDMDALREHVRAEMARQNISSQKLADLTINSKGTIDNFLNTSTVPAFDRVFSICAALGSGWGSSAGGSGGSPARAQLWQRVRPRHEGCPPAGNGNDGTELRRHAGKPERGPRRGDRGAGAAPPRRSKANARLARGGAGLACDFGRHLSMVCLGRDRRGSWIDPLRPRGDQLAGQRVSR